MSKQQQKFHILVFPDGSVVKNLPANAGVMGSILGSRRSPGEGNCNPFQYSSLGNTMDRGAGQATVHGITRVRHDLATTQQIHFFKIYIRVKLINNVLDSGVQQSD